jgi:hypothetical protein
MERPPFPPSLCFRRDEQRNPPFSFHFGLKKSFYRTPLPE